MPELPEQEVGLVACSGEELAEGTVTRLACLKVLHDLRPRDTVTICLPLFLAGGAGDRAFARIHPTITVDGCDLRCAARATEMYSSKPAASLVVSELVAEAGFGKPEGCRQLNRPGQQAVGATAERLAALVDRVLRQEGRKPSTDDRDSASTTQKASEATCSCGSGVPVTKLSISGKFVEMVALPLIFQKFRETGRSLDEAFACELFDTVKIYNAVPSESERNYRAAVLREYAAFCQKERTA